MRAQTKVLDSYVTVRLTHMQLLALERAAESAINPNEMEHLFDDGHGRRAMRDAHEIVENAADALRSGHRGGVTRAGVCVRPRANSTREPTP